VLIRPTMSRNEVAGGDVGAQMIAWDRAGLFGIPLAVLGLLVPLAGLADSIGWALVFVAVALFALLLVTVSVAWMVRKLAQRLEFSGGVLTYRDWRGRTVTLGAPQDILVTRGQVAYKSALALDVPILVVGGAPDAEPVLLRARHWRRTDLSALWRRLKVRPVGAFDRVYTAEEMLQQFPGIRLPWSLSRPALTWGLTTLVVLSWIAGTIALIAMLVE
jgi:uncharacterized membrane protein